MGLLNGTAASVAHRQCAACKTATHTDRHRQNFRTHALSAKTWRSCLESGRRFDSNIPSHATKPAVHGAVGAFFWNAPYHRPFSSRMSTMTRCPTTRSAGPIGLAARAWLAGLVLAWWGAALPAAEQLQPAPGVTRPFPASALRGILSFSSAAQATVNGQSVRVAPGMRLFNPQNQLVMLHSVLGQSLRVNYLLEAGTGMLHSAWILTEKEAALPRKGSNAVITNITSGSDANSK